MISYNRFLLRHGYFLQTSSTLVRQQGQNWNVLKATTKEEPTAYNVYQSASEHRKHGFSKFFWVAARRDFLTLCSKSRLAASSDFLSIFNVLSISIQKFSLQTILFHIDKVWKYVTHSSSREARAKWQKVLGSIVIVAFCQLKSTRDIIQNVRMLIRKSRVVDYRFYAEKYYPFFMYQL